MDTNLVTAQTTTTGTAANTARGSSVLSSDFATFLTMLTAQAKYQDPLEPIDSTQYASQLAQFSGVEQQVLGNEFLSQIAAQFGNSNIAQLAGWVGMEARSTAAVGFDGSPVVLYPKPAFNADQAFLIVRNENGKEMQRSAIPVSDDPVEWAGVSENGTPFSAGLYQFEVESYAGGTLVKSNAVESYATIIEARKTGSQTTLILKGGGEVTAEGISALRTPL